MFFFKRFPRLFFEELFNLLIKDTIVAESQENIIGFVTTTRGLSPLTHIKVIRLIPRLVTLLTASKRSVFVYVLQKLRNTDRAPHQLGVACIAVRKGWRGMGVGSSLTREALAKYPNKDVVLEVRPWNASAIRLYTRAGFKKAGVWGDPLGGWIAMKRTNSSLQ
jgi:ribosomal protein S18 acetylase RimI-like enzyme